MKITFLIVGLILLSTNLVWAAPGGRCEAQYLGEANGLIWAAIYPKGIDGKAMPGGFMQIAYESEYLLDEAAPILRDYAPSDGSISRAAWSLMSDEAHIQWLKSHFGERPEFATQTGLRKQVGVTWMPEELIVDSTGNLEIVLPPFNDFGDWESAIDWIIARYGVGSQQAMISKPREAAFLADRPDDAQMQQQNLGWLVYTNLRDTFEKLRSGFERFQKDPSKLTAQSFDHAFLGPMTKIKRDEMEAFLKANASLKLYDDKSKKFVRKSDASFKYTSGPSYRPDIAGPARFSWELRNSHRDVADLKMKVLRDINAHVTGLERFKEFSKVEAFDSITHFDKLPTNLKKMLSHLFPSKADSRFQYTEDELRSLESYRNFALPMMDFSSLARALNPDRTVRLLDQVSNAQSAYLNSLMTTAELLEVRKIDETQAKARVMGALCSFAVNSGLSPAFDAKAMGIGDEVPLKVPEKTTDKKTEKTLPAAA